MNRTKTISATNDVELEQFKQSFNPNTSQEELNQLLEHHLLEKNNLSISEFLLQNGANPDSFSKNQYVANGGRIRHTKYTNQPLSIQIIYCHNAYLYNHDEESLLLNDKLSLLLKFNANPNIESTTGESLISLLSNIKFYVSHKYPDEFDNTLRKAIATVLKAGATVSQDVYNSNRERFAEAVVELMKNDTSKNPALGYNTFQQLLGSTSLEKVKVRC